MPAAEAVIAANRFGLGARPGDLARLGSDARGSLLQQVRGPAPLLTQPLPSSQELLGKVIAARASQREDGQRRGSNAPVSAPAAAVGRQLLETYLPAYLAVVTARTRAAIGSERDFLERLVQWHRGIRPGRRGPGWPGDGEVARAEVRAALPGA